MVKHEQDASMSGDRKRRGRDGSLSDHSRRHRRHPDDRRSRSPRGDSHSDSSSPDVHRHKKKSHRHKERHRNDRREEHRHEGDERVRFDPDHRIKEERTDRSKRNEHVSFDRERRIKEERNDRAFEEQQNERQRNDDRRREARQQRERENGSSNFAQPSAAEEAASSAQEKEKPNFELSGKLTEDTNTYRGVVIKYNEPAEARKAKRRWRLYGFKGDQALPFLPIHRQSAYLLGRDRRVADIPVDHPSCSKQHAVLQYRLTEYTRPDGTLGRKVRPYIIDLGSANGTYVNNQRIESQRYVELFERDLIKFGFSTREFVLLPENADTSEVAQNSDTE